MDNNLETWEHDRYYSVEFYSVDYGFMKTRAAVDCHPSNLDSMADALTNVVMGAKFEERFWNSNDITVDAEMSDTWDFVNDKVYAMLEEVFQ